jgi:uracil-DNA glycosylase
MKISIGSSWKTILKEEFEKPYFLALRAFLKEELRGNCPIYPPVPLIFNAFVHTPFEKVKVVIIGQDPYHGPGQAEGLCFSVPSSVPIPPSLQNIFKELKSDLDIPPASKGSLLSWADQGVLLLNATLTVREGQPQSHAGRGWEPFTDAVIEKLVEREDPLIFMLWGRSAQQKVALILKNRKTAHVVLTAPHPSPLSAYQGFLGCHHFSKANQLLEAWGKQPILWALPE